MSERDFTLEPDRLSDAYKAIMDGDAVRAAEIAAETTTWSLSPNQVSMIIAIGFIYAAATLIGKLQPLAQPAADALGARLKPKPKPVPADEDYR